MYAVYGLILLGVLGILFGFMYRWSLAVFILSFSYSELVDATNYLNHYYLVVLIGILLFFVPANRAVSLDCKMGRCRRLARVPRWNITILQLQLGLVYFFAGFAKLNPDWMLHGMPLATWMPEHAHWPLLGELFNLEMTPLLFSWAGAFYDLSIPVWLSFAQTRRAAYFAVIVFHSLTGFLFNIGLFPMIMTGCTLVFFSPHRHEQFWKKTGLFSVKEESMPTVPSTTLIAFLALFFSVQILLPLRHYVLPGDVLWNEAGYRFSWRVMLVEKHGHARFTVHDGCSDRWAEVQNDRYLSDFQEKNMVIQPDFILQYADFLKRTYREEYGFCEPVVKTDSYVSLNGRPAQRFAREDIDLTTISPWEPYASWIKPLRHE